MPACETCQKFKIEYNWQDHTGTGKVVMQGNPGTPSYRKAVRAPGEVLPCRNERIGCPKESPEKERDHILSEKNWQAWEHFKRVRAMGRMSDEEASDEAIQRVFVILDDLTQRGERRRLAREIARQLPVIVLKG